jgi:hypothetical protein
VKNKFKKYHVFDKTFWKHGFQILGIEIPRFLKSFGE